MLVSLGENAPDAFLTRAEALGATGFIQSPLSLKLLHKAVAGGGDWPTTRHKLFETAVRSLAHESSDEHRWADRSTPDDIISAAAKACLVLLASGSRAFWRSSAEPSGQDDDRRAYVTAHDLRFDRKLLSDMLDTALFRGDGEAFEPMHRTVAEFLAGQALARAVVGDGDRAALSLSRAVAMITGDHERPPSELRGLYARLAAHLAVLDDEAGGIRMIEADAFTVLACWWEIMVVACAHAPARVSTQGSPQRPATTRGLKSAEPSHLLPRCPVGLCVATVVGIGRLTAYNRHVVGHYRLGESFQGERANLFG